MMKKLLILCLLIACAQNLDVDDHTMMRGMPCHQMADGNWMGDCDQQSFEVKDATNIALKPQIIALEDGESYNITATPVKKIIKGKEINMFAYNGMIPGPILAAKKGSTITVHFHNNLDVETTIHWHGLRHDNKNDGVPGVTQEAVKPGEDFTYEVYFPDNGLFWYHPHVREDVQQDLGLAGTMIVSSGSEYQEEILVLDDILLDNEGIVAYGKDEANFAMMGRFGNVMLVNGEENYEIETPGNVRLYFANVANVRPFNLSIPGAKMKLVGSDLGLYEYDAWVDSVVIAPAQRYIVEVQFPKKGMYTLIHHSPFGTKDLSSFIVAQAGKDMSLNEHKEMQNEVQQFASQFSRAPDYTLELDSQMGHRMGGMGSHVEEIEWEDTMAMMNAMMNSGNTEWIIRDRVSGKKNMDINIKSKVGDVLKIRLVNSEQGMHPMQHPFHIHGQRFMVTHIDGVPVENHVWQDTVLVRAGSTVDILVDVTNPGKWMMHCHIAEHLEAGMMSMLTVEQ